MPPVEINLAFFKAYLILIKSLALEIILHNE